MNFTFAYTTWPHEIQFSFMNRLAKEKITNEGGSVFIVAKICLGNMHSSFLGENAYLEKERKRWKLSFAEIDCPFTFFKSMNIRKRSIFFAFLSLSLRFLCTQYSPFSLSKRKNNGLSKPLQHPPLSLQRKGANII